MKRIVATAGIAVALLLSASAPAFALGDLREAIREREEGRKHEGRTQVAAPEIDVAAGSKAVAVIILALLLAAEGYRRRR